jgi:acetyl-CoA carboxylase biotin carboxyl carrier protein
MDLKDIKAIIDLMKKNSISEFELERQDFKIKLKRTNGQSGEEGQGGHIYMQAPAPVGQAASGPVHPALPASQPASAPAVTGETEIKSPMVGTIYRAPSPEAANYVEVGAEVNPDTVVCIIEAMKVMNEIKAETRGVITAIMVDNAKPVEFGQPLFKIRPT